MLFVTCWYSSSHPACLSLSQNFHLIMMIFFSWIHCFFLNWKEWKNRHSWGLYSKTNCHYLLVPNTLALTNMFLLLGISTAIVVKFICHMILVLMPLCLEDKTLHFFTNHPLSASSNSIQMHIKQKEGLEW